MGIPIMNCGKCHLKTFKENDQAKMSNSHAALELSKSEDGKETAIFWGRNAADNLLLVTNSNHT